MANIKTFKPIKRVVKREASKDFTRIKKEKNPPCIASSLELELCGYKKEKAELRDISASTDCISIGFDVEDKKGAVELIRPMNRDLWEFSIEVWGVNMRLDFSDDTPDREGAEVRAMRMTPDVKTCFENIYFDQGLNLDWWVFSVHFDQKDIRSIHFSSHNENPNIILRTEEGTTTYCFPESWVNRPSFE